MNTDGMIFRSHSMNSEVDRTIRALADERHTTYGTIFRLLLETGLARLEDGEDLPRVVEDAALILRPVHIRVETDEALRVRSYKHRISRGELVSRILYLGLRAWK